MPCPGRWPAPRTIRAGVLPELGEDAAWVIDAMDPGAGHRGPTLDADFFASGGGSLSAAQLVSALRVRYRTVTVAEIYSHPRIGSLLEALGTSSRRRAGDPHRGPHHPARPGLPDAHGHPHVHLGGHALAGVPGGRQQRRWAPWACSPTHPRLSWWWVAALWLVFVSPPGRMGISVVAARLLLRSVKPGNYPRSGKVHLRLWLAQQIADLADAVSLASAHVDAVLRPRAGREDRAGMCNCTRSRRSPACSPWAAEPTSSPRWISPATGSTGTGSTSAPSRSAPRPASGHAAR